MRHPASLVLLASSLLLGCGGGDTRGGAGGGGSAGGAGGAGATGTAGAMGGRPQLSDGTLGSSCTTSCQAGLQCGLQAPGGYCTRACTSTPECGSGAYCYQTAAGPGCLRACQSDLDCREGYACQGTAGATACYPAAAGTGGGGGGGGGACSEGFLLGKWGYCGDGGYCEEITFNAGGGADYAWWNSVSGNAYSAGSWMLQCPIVQVNLTSGYDVGKMLSWEVRADGLYEGSRRFGRCSGSCF